MAHPQHRKPQRETVARPAPAPDPPLLYTHAPRRGRAWAARLRGHRPLFVCTIAQTDTARIPGISAAGATPELRELTPAADAEALYYGSARCLHGVPANPLGPPGPAIITVAALRLARIPFLVVDAGTRVRPQAPAIRLGEAPGACITTGRAVPHADDLYQRGRLLGAQLAACADYLVLAASDRVPVLLAGGTQMAAVLALMHALRAAEGRALDPRRVAIATTRWVLADPTADLPGLVAQLGPYAVLGTGLRFTTSRHAPLRRYEDFLVKEGVGAGGAAVAATLRKGATADQLRRAAERV